MKSRRACREAALQALYQCDTLGDFSPECVQEFFDHFQGQVEEGEPDEVARRESDRFCSDLALGVIEQLAFLDSRITMASTHWSITRMSRVDRNILRLGAFELAFRTDVPTRVCLNEAIEVAKRFGSDDSPMFVNGVLDRIASALAENPQPVADAVARAALKRVSNG